MPKVSKGTRCMNMGISQDRVASLDDIHGQAVIEVPECESRRSWLGKNVSSLFVSFAALGIAQFVTLGLISRFGGAEKAGIWAYANAFRDPFLAFMDFGIVRLLEAEIARRRDESDLLLGNALTLELMIGLPVLGAMMAAANLDVLKLSPVVVRAIYLTGLSALLFTVASSLRSAFRAFNRFEYEAIISVITAVIMAGSTLVVLRLEFPFIWLFVGIVLSQLLALLCNKWIYDHRLGRVKLAYEASVVRQLLSKAWAFTFVGLLSRAFKRVDILILTFFHGESAAGYYGLATTLFYQLNSIPQLLTTAILPTMALSYVRQRGRIGRQLDATVRVQVLVALPSAVIGLTMAPRIIHFLYGPGYQATAGLFRLLITVVALRFVNKALGISLTAMDQQGRRAAILCFTVASGIVVNFILIPRWSVMGAAATCVASEVVLFGLSYIAIAPGVRRSIQWGRLVRPLLGAVALVPLLFLIRDLPLLVSLPLSGVAFAVMLFLFRTFSQEETKAMVEMMERVRLIPVPIRRRLSALMINRARGQAQTI